MVLVSAPWLVLAILVDDVRALILDIHPAPAVLLLISLFIEEAGELLIGHLESVNPKVIQIDRVHGLFVAIGATIAIAGTHEEIASRDVNHQ
jgi:hypothetical protein